jgi:hypothetical protein
MLGLDIKLQNFIFPNEVNFTSQQIMFLLTKLVDPDN